MLKAAIRGLAAGAILIAAASTAAGEDRIRVVASFSIIADLVRNVGGDRVAVTALIGPNGDTHVFEPRPADAAALAGARLILINGLGLEGFIPRLVKASGTKADVVELASGTRLLPALDHDADNDPHDDAAHGHGHDEGEAGNGTHAAEEAQHDHGPHDPHAWQSVPNARIYVANATAALCTADPAGCEAYRANEARYDEALAALDRDMRAALGSLPQDRRTIITSHEAFRHFGAEYGLDFLAPEGTSTEAEASAADVARLIRQARENKASAIFVENVSNPRLVQQIAAETGLAAGGRLFSDALSEEGGPAPTYLEMMRHNLATILTALKGS